jgi:hypothetical protein
MPRHNQTLRAVPATKAVRGHRATTKTTLPTVALANKPALLASEDPKEYAKLDSGYRQHAEPRDIIEEWLAGDVVDNQWHVTRLRRLRADFVRARADASVREIARSKESDGMASLSLAGDDPGPTEPVNDLVEKHGLVMSTIEAGTYAADIETIERFDQMIAAAADRRNGALADIERRRRDEARLRPEQPPIDADFVEVDKTI